MKILDTKEVHDVEYNPDYQFICWYKVIKTNETLICAFRNPYDLETSTKKLKRGHILIGSRILYGSYFEPQTLACLS